MKSQKMQPRLKLYGGMYDGGDLGPRVSLSLDGLNSFLLSFTSKGVHRFSGGQGVERGSDYKPKVFKGGCDDFHYLPIVSSVNRNGVKIDCESDGRVALIVAYDSSGRNLLLKITREGIYRYRFISQGLLDALEFPHDSARALLILR